MTETYADVVAWLYALEASGGVDLKLHRVRRALRQLGNPESEFRSVHVAGTNGKGSVAAMVRAVLSAQGYRVGLYTSPHLLNLTERVQIGDVAIAEDSLVNVVQEVRAAQTKCEVQLTFFEFMTVAAFLYFARERLDVAVVEVGLGGRFDATNVIVPEVAVITSVDLDHQEFLGDTPESIAGEKAGIVKPGCPLVVGKLLPQASRVVSEVARQTGAQVYESGRQFRVTDTVGFGFEGMGLELDNVRLALRGAHQKENAALAVAAVRLLANSLPVSDDALRRGLETARWPGRLEVFGSAPMVVVDAAHNPAGMRTLVAELPALVGDRRVHLLFGALRDKDWRPMIGLLWPLVDEATVTTIMPPRGEDAKVLAAEFRRYCRVRTVPDPARAFAQTLAAATPESAIVVTGSIFLVAAVYEQCLAAKGGAGAGGDSATVSPAGV
jgi:dihydrofolate synthase/folylpolyglutamate synthase